MLDLYLCQWRNCICDFVSCICICGHVLYRCCICICGVKTCNSVGNFLYLLHCFEFRIYWKFNRPFAVVSLRAQPSSLTALWSYITVFGLNPLGFFTAPPGGELSAHRFIAKLARVWIHRERDFAMSVKLCVYTPVPPWASSCAACVISPHALAPSGMS